MGLISGRLKKGKKKRRAGKSKPESISEGQITWLIFSSSLALLLISAKPGHASCCSVPTTSLSVYPTTNIGTVALRSLPSLISIPGRFFIRAKCIFRISLYFRQAGHPVQRSDRMRGSPSPTTPTRPLQAYSGRLKGRYELRMLRFYGFYLSCADIVA